MPRICLIQRRLTAVFVAAVIVSIVVGETRAAAPHVAPVAHPALLAVGRCDPVDGCGAIAPPRGRTSDTESPGQVVGLPPWLIFPPAPVPRSSRTLVRPLVLLSRFSHVFLSLRAVSLSESLTSPPLERANNNVGQDLGPRHLARLAGSFHSTPRPPPV
jgi:hypothetical protein